MSTIRFGLRTVRVKIFKLSDFNISKSEAESLTTYYDGFDLWNTDQKVTVEKPQIEKRKKYFHIMFIPFFPVETQWTIRNKKGVFKVNNVCKQKIKSSSLKSYAHWYLFFAPIVFLIVTSSMFIQMLANSYTSNKHFNRELKKEHLLLVNKLDSVSPPYYIVFNNGRFDKKFKRVDSVSNNVYYISHIVNNKLSYDSRDYLYHKEFETKKLESLIYSKEQLISLIPKNSEEYYELINNKIIEKIVSVSDLEKPNLDFYFNSVRPIGLRIINYGKPLTLVNVENKSKQIGKWSILKNKYIDTGKNIEIGYKPINIAIDTTKLILIFTDGKNHYRYDARTIYKKNKKLNGHFVKKSVEMIK